MNQLHIPALKSWRLNERMYGVLTGFAKMKQVSNWVQNWCKAREEA